MLKKLKKIILSFDRKINLPNKLIDWETTTGISINIIKDSTGKNIL
jgi:hypothetical protein